MTIVTIKLIFHLFPSLEEIRNKSNCKDKNRGVQFVILGMERARNGEREK